MIFINKNLNFFLLKKRKILIINIFSKNIYNIFFLKLNETNLIFNKNLKYLKIIKINIDLLKEIKKFLNIHNFFYLKKIVFNGKGFKLKKIKEKNVFNFNNSHLKVLIERNNKIIKNNKNSFLYIFKNSFSNKLKNLSFILKLFKMNIFTKRGVKISRNFTYIKKIKKK